MVDIQMSLLYEKILTKGRRFKSLTYIIWPLKKNFLRHIKNVQMLIYRMGKQVFK